jgi:hypothetical protein
MGANCAATAARRPKEFPSMAEATLETGGQPIPRHACPRCGGATYRVHRHLLDRMVGVVRRVRRYRCKAGDCGWEGLLSSSGRDAKRKTFGGVLSAWLIASLVLVPLLVLVAVMYRTHVLAKLGRPAAGAARVAAVAPTTPAPAATVPDPAKGGTSPGEPKRGCVWEGPGRQPYGGTLAAALVGAQLPADVIDKLTLMRERGLVSDRLEISSAGIRTADRRRQFGFTTKAMALSDGVCFGTTVDVATGLTGTADLYELSDQEGRRYLVMIVARGNNVALLEEQAER